MRRLRLALLLLILTLLFPACRRDVPPPTASEVLTAMLAAMEETAQTIPAGVLRLTAAPADSPDYLTDTFFSALYGEAARGLLTAEGEDGYRAVNDATLFLSMSAYPCELAVFRCSDVRGAATVAGLCRSRLDTLARGFKGSEWEDVAAGGQIIVEGCFVVMVVAEDPRGVLEAARGVLG